jgi:hypothetical protein
MRFLILLKISFASLSLKPVKHQNILFRSTSVTLAPNVIKLRKYLSFRQRRNHIKLAYHYEIPRTSEGQKGVSMS